MEGNIRITEYDYIRLRDLINAIKSDTTVERENINILGSEIQRAEKVDPKKIGSDSITMNSEFEITDLDTNRSMVVKLVYPHEADFKKGCISVLSPLGSALLGYREGDEIAFAAPKGIKRIQIRRMIYQPEANGEYTI